MERVPESILECVAFFSDEDKAHDFFVKMRWPEGVRCAHCDSPNIGKLVRTESRSRSKLMDGQFPKLTVRRVWHCKACKKQFAAKTGTVFHKSPLPLSKWVPAFWLVVNAKNGISSSELARALKMFQKTAWRVGCLIRMAIQRGGGIVRADGVFERDENCIGGKKRNRYAPKHRKKIKGTRGKGKSAVAGALAHDTEKMPTS